MSVRLIKLDTIADALTGFSGRVVIYSACASVSILLHLIIVYISRTELFGFGTGSEAVMDVTYIKMGHMVGMCASLPIAIDFFLDSIARENFFEFLYRPVFFFRSIIFGLVFLYFLDQMTVTVYMAMYHCNGLVTMGVAFVAMDELLENNLLAQLILIISYIGYNLYLLVKITALAHLIGGGILAPWVQTVCITPVLAAGAIIGSQTLLRAWNNWAKMGDREVKLFLYVALLLVLGTLLAHANISYNMANLSGINEEYFVTSKVYFVMFAAFVAIIPGRLARINFEQSKSMLTMKGVFVKYISHEIRSPLNVVFAGLEMIHQEINRSRATKNIQELVTDMFESAHTAIHLLNDLLHYESLASDTFKLDTTWRQIPDVLVNVQMNQFEILAKKAAVDLEYEDNLNLLGSSSAARFLGANAISAKFTLGLNLRAIAVNVDLIRIEQIVRILITNALSSTPKFGTVTFRTRMELMPREEARYYHLVDDAAVIAKLFIEVVDTGFGVSESRGNKTSALEEGITDGGLASLGLFNSRKIALMHNGKVNITAGKSGSGSTFSLMIPVYNVPHRFRFYRRVKQFLSPEEITERVLAAEEEAYRDGGTSDNKSAKKLSRSGLSQQRLAQSENDREPEEKCIMEGARVLIVDDSATNRKILKRLLDGEKIRFPKMTIEEAEDGDQAVTMVQASVANDKPYHFVMMDNFMVKLNGPEAASQMREGKFKGAIIGVTGNASSDDIDAYKKLGANHVLAKPITRANLIAALSVKYGKK